MKSEAISIYSRVNPNFYASSHLLFRRRGDRARFPGEELVVVTTPIFQHKISKGYDEVLGQVIVEVNGTKVKNLAHLVATLRDLKDEDMTMLMATHEMSFARDVADQVVFLDAGRVCEAGPPEQVFGDPREVRTQQFLRRVVDAGRL